MANKVEICNMALSALGHSPIQALDETSQEAVAANTIYDITFDNILATAPWNFATKVATLAELSDETSDEYDYCYGYPTDCLRALQIVNTVNETPIPFEVLLQSGGQARMIVTDEEDASLRYICDIDTETLLTPAFVAAFAVKLAIAMCPMLVSGTDATKLTQLQNYFQTVALPEALKLDAIEGTNGPTLPDPIGDSRA